ncbi:hypothetical protein QQF64_022114 [Cirrhinus molitorella]|uniref:Uncharacterized protein n=1 Tax=Cirrhinus molitorella TaxID=172907 RepID=A0ABR3L787_9TELE
MNAFRKVAHVEIYRLSLLMPSLSAGVLSKAGGVMWGCHLGSQDSATSDLKFSTTEIDHFQIVGYLSLSPLFGDGRPGLYHKPVSPGLIHGLCLAVQKQMLLIYSETVMARTHNTAHLVLIGRMLERASVPTTSHLFPYLTQAALSALKQLSEQGLDPVDGPIKVENGSCDIQAKRLAERTDSKPTNSGTTAQDCKDSKAVV